LIRFPVSASFIAKAAGRAASQSASKKRPRVDLNLLAMRKTGKLVCLSALAAGSLFLGRASQAVSADAAEESCGRPSSPGAQRSASPATELFPGAHAGGKTFAVGRDLDQSHTPPAGELMDAVITNELMDREKLRKWICLIEKRAGKQILTEVQVETKEGPLYRLLAIDGTALNPDQWQQDDARIGRLIKDPRPLQKLEQSQDEDELKLQKLMSLMPEAFVFDYDGTGGNFLRVKFRPNPGYIPPTYEARVIHSLAGTILIDLEHKRLTKVAGQLMNRFEFGYGLLGRIDSGRVEIARIEVGPQQWKTVLINIHFSGRLAIFKTISKEQYERRSDFRTVSNDLSLADVKDLLVSRALPPPQNLQTSK
jgi:hypothetical protein